MDADRDGFYRGGGRAGAAGRFSAGEPRGRAAAEGAGLLALAATDGGGRAGQLAGARGDGVTEDAVRGNWLQSRYLEALPVGAAEVAVGGFLVVEGQLRGVPLKRGLWEADGDTAEEDGLGEWT